MKNQNTKSKVVKEVKKYASVSEASRKLSHGTYSGTAPVGTSRKANKKA